ncbi:MAG TPA: fructose-bisphosphatase class II, partial [bacterium]|nr:fructose-bisphosphatase class II [bacterium]
MPTSTVNPELVFSLRRVTERAATAAFSWIGRGDGQDAGRAALDAMREALAEVDIDAVVAIGEATPGEAPQPQRGERLGRPGAAFKADIAVDPVEGTSYLVRGQ